MKIPIAKTKLTEKEFNIIRKPLESGWLVQGQYVKNFEDKFSDYIGVKHSIAVTSCTAALHLSLSALGLSSRDEVILPAFTWISTANIVEHIGAKVVFCDINSKTFNIDVDKIETLITPRTKAIIPVHLFGLATDMDKIMEIAEKYDLWVIEDAACGFGSKYKNKHVGSFGNVGCFSFHPRKVITTGEGGMITTDDDDLAEKLRAMRDHGAKISDFQRHHGTKPYLLPDFPYAGYNYRMTDIQASIGFTQMDRVSEILSERRELAQRYNDSLSNLDFFQIPFEDSDYQHGFQSYPCLFDVNLISSDSITSTNIKRNNFMEILQSKGISTRPATHAVHMLTYYKEKYQIDSRDYSNSLLANETSISFPFFNGMKPEEYSYIIKNIKENI
ncbi:MAG: DegT/DnrJ/EryC1/StrS family aminotransferase [Candidatus Neomarinimicrobiota bacterium]